MRLLEQWPWCLSLWITVLSVLSESVLLTATGLSPATASSASGAPLFQADAGDEDSGETVEEPQTLATWRGGERVVHRAAN